MDSIKIEILADGTIKVETDKVSGANHVNAEAFMKFLADKSGGEVTRTSKGHIHDHAHTHEHGEAGHTHVGGTDEDKK